MVTILSTRGRAPKELLGMASGLGTEAVPGSLAIVFQWEGDATLGYSGGARAVHVPDDLRMTGWKVEAVDAAGLREDASVSFAVEARPEAGGALYSLVGGGTAPGLSAEPEAAANTLDWTGGLVERHGTLVVRPSGHTRGDSSLLSLTLFCVRAGG